MNITRENLSDLELCIKIDIEEKDYIENVNKQLKEYQHKATIPGFRKGMAPKGLIERMYKGAIVGDAVHCLPHSESRWLRGGEEWKWRAYLLPISL